MKKLFFILTTFLLCGVGNVWGASGDSYTFASATGSYDDNVSFSYENTVAANEPACTKDGLKIYNGDIFVITPENGVTITKFVITATSTNYAKTWSVSAGGGQVNVSDATITWTGSSTTDVKIKNTASAQARFKSIVVTYEEVSTDPNAPSLSVTPVEIDFGLIATGETFAEQTITVEASNIEDGVLADFKESTTAFELEGVEELYAGTSNTFTVKCVATAVGTHTAQIDVVGGDITKTISLTATILNGNGSKEKPFTVDDVLTLNNTKTGSYWVTGYILGSIDSNGKGILAAAEAVETSLALGATADAIYPNCVSVQLSSGDARTTLNVKDNPSNVGKQVKVYGSLEKYLGSLCGVKGIKTTDHFELEGVAKPEDKGAISVADFLEAKDDINIYTLTGVVSEIELYNGAYSYYGNFKITDDTGTIYIRGLLTADGTPKKFDTLGIDNGDIVTLKGTYTEYEGTPQIEDATYVSHVDKKPTALDNVVEEAKAVKVIENGQLVIIKDGVRYSVLGSPLR